MIWFSLLVLIPLSAIIVKAAGGAGSATFEDVLTNDNTRSRPEAHRVSARSSSPPINMVMGTIIAWVLVRDRFPGKGLIDLVIDIPFAMPTIVAGLVLLSLYGPESPIGVEVNSTRMGGAARDRVRDPAVRGPDRAAGARGARDRRRGRRGVARAPLEPRRSAGSSCPRWCRRSSPGRRCRSRGRSASTARWCCSAATCPNRPRSSRCGVLSASRAATAVRGRGRDDHAPGGAAGDRALRRDPGTVGAPWLAPSSTVGREPAARS